MENASLVSKDVSNVNQPASTSTEGGLPSPVTTRQDRTAPSTSAAFRKGVPLETIMAAAGWCAECTFATYYKEDVTEDNNYGRSILNGSVLFLLLDLIVKLQ